MEEQSCDLRSALEARMIKDETSVWDLFVASLCHVMAVLGNPYAVVITSPPLAESSTAYLVRWNMISSGGLPIIEYEFKYKRVSVRTACVLN